jgi:hypothetical protein
MEITLEKYDSITIEKPDGSAYVVNMVHEEHSFTPGTVIDTDKTTGLLEVARNYKSLYVTEKHKESLERASNGMTTSFTQVNRK